MFDAKYYRNRYIYELENGYKAMVELNRSRGEYYCFLPNEDDKYGYDIVLRKFAKRPLDVEKIESLSGLLLKHGFTDRDFANPFGRTRKLVTTIDVINEIEMRANKTKIKK